MASLLTRRQSLALGLGGLVAGCGDVLAWGMVDSYSWLQSFARRSDGLPLRPDPYDGSDQPKQLHQSIVDAFAATAARPA